METEGKELNFFIIDGELKCEECSIQTSFQKQVSKIRKKKDDIDPSLALPDTYNYFCVECKLVTEWNNNGDKTSSCKVCSL